MLQRSGIVRRFAVRGLDLAGIAKKVTDPAAKADLARLRQVAEDATQEAKRAQEPVAPIDWAFYKANLSDKNIVDQMEKDFKATTYPAFTSDSAAKAEALKKEILAEASGVMEQSKKRVQELEAMLADVNANRTTRSTTIDDVARRYPDLDKEVMQEIKEQRWSENI